MDWQLTCRVCMDTGEMVSMFDWDQTNKQLGDKYAYCCGVEVTEDDPLPKLMCLNCVDRLTLAYDFKVQCISSNNTLKEFLEEYVCSLTGEPMEKRKQSAEVDTFTVKENNGTLLQYHVTKTTSPAPVITMAPVPKKRGRPKKLRGQEGQHFLGHWSISDAPSLFRKKLQHESEKTGSYATLSTGSQEQNESADETIGHEDVDTEDNDLDANEDVVEMNSESEGQLEPRKRRKQFTKKKQKHEEDMDQLINKETLSEPEPKPVPDQTLNPKSKNKNSVKKKKVRDKKHVCETCNASLSSNFQLQVHIRRHLGIKPFACKLCGFAAVTKEDLQQHTRKHTKLRPYKCSVCDKTYSDCGAWKKHERTHTGERPYECKICKKTFNYSYVRNYHMRTHAGKQYSCEQCNKKFASLFVLQRHNQRFHKELYEQLKLQAELKKSRQEINLHGIVAAFEKFIEAEEDGKEAAQLLYFDETQENVEDAANEVEA